LKSPETSESIKTISPRSEIVQKSEIDAKTVLEKFPDSEQAELYRKLADSICNNDEFIVPEPFEVDEFDQFFRKFQ
jgi:nitrogenase iron protein NifH